MSSEPHEIVIIKRHSGGHEEEHHGGVWKIAFADFMTAMMAFFLVMWLISANDKTKAVIARYFNPVQLVDSTPQPKGLEDPKAGSPSVMPKSAAPAPEPKDKAEKSDVKSDKSEGKSESKGAEAGKVANPPKAVANSAETLPTDKHDEAALFRDPYAVLAEIAGKNQTQSSHQQTKADSEGAKGGSGAVGRKGGDAYRDPFEPLPVAGGPALESFAQDNATIVNEQPPAPASPTPPAAGTAKADQSPTRTDAPPPAKSGAVQEVREPPLAAQIEAALKQTAATTSAGMPKLDIHRTDEGTVIDLTDGASFAMFESASARPSATMVRLMEKVGAVLKAQKGLVTIRGFTDARPFRSDTYDNWRLSSARAHMAHYMLVRGGLDEQRVERIEGYADHQLKNAKDPNGAENRRIEILLRNPAP